MWFPIISLLLFLLNQAAAIVVLLMADAMSGRLGDSSPEALMDAMTHFDIPRYGTVLFLTTVLLIGILLATRLTGKGVLTAFRRGMPKGWAWGIAGFVSFALGLNAILSLFDIEDAGVSAFFSGMQDNVWCAMLIVLAAPLSEELVFRDSIIRGMSQVGRRTAILVSAFAFAVVHGNLMQCVPAFILGVVLALLYLHTGDLRLCFPAHVCNNALAFADMRYPHLTQMAERWSPWIVSMVGISLLCCGAWMLRLQLKRQEMP